jgi:hypothetical protein
VAKVSPTLNDGVRLTHVSPLKPNRVYIRKFDHDKARARYAAGESVAAMAREFGVTDGAVWQVVSPRMIEAYRKRAEKNKTAGICDDCGGPMHLGSRYRGSTRCRDCASLVLATNVRPDSLRCPTCREWKPDEDFPFSRGVHKHHRDRHAQCRLCLTVARRSHRQRNREAHNKYQREYRRRRAAGVAA